MSKKNFDELYIDDLHGVAYDCFVQQLIALCEYYRNEYWKLIVGFEIISTNDDNDSIDRRIQIREKKALLENMRKYYGLELVQKSVNDINNNQVYLINFKTEFYPACKGIDLTRDARDSWLHSFILYKVENGKYYINDNFYGLKKYLLDKDTFEKGVYKVYEVVDDKEKVAQSDISLLRHSIDMLNTKTLIEWVSSIKPFKDTYNEYEYFVILRKICSRLERFSKVLRSIELNSKFDLFILELSNSYSALFHKHRNFWYKMKKYQIRYSGINQEIMYSKMQELLEFLKIENQINERLLELIDNVEDNIASRLLDKVKEYNPLAENLSRSVYDDHDGVTLLNFLNYFDKEFSIDLDAIDFSGKKTYGEFLSVVYKKIIYKIHEIPIF